MDLAILTGSTPFNKYLLGIYMMIECQHLSKKFEQTEALNNISFHIAKEECVSILGPSGCGKSTLLRIIAGLEVPDAGQVLLGEQTITNNTSVILPPEKRHFGIIFQDFALFPHLNIFDNIAYGLEGDKESQKKRVQELLSLVNLESKSHEMPHRLSGGEQQRVAVARALAPRPQLLLMDEPFSSLDHQLRVQLRREIKALLRHEKVASILVTHDQSEAISFSDRLLLMCDGNLIQQDAPQKVYHYPVNTWAASFMGAASFLPLSWKEGTLYGPLGKLSSEVTHTQDAHSLMVRPEDVKLTSVPIHDDQEGTRCKISNFVEFYGAFQVFEVEITSPNFPQIRLRVQDTSNALWHIGETVQVSLKKIQLFDADGNALTSQTEFS